MRTLITVCLLLTLFVGCKPPPKSAKKKDQTPETTALATPVETEQVKAGVGVGIKGRSLDEYEGAVVTPAKTLFAAKERIAFEIEVPHALQLYKALEGQGPKDTDEFMEKIVKYNNIHLPQLPPGHKYIYDPTTEQLMVERPAKKAAAPPPAETEAK